MSAFVQDPLIHAIRAADDLMPPPAEPGVAERLGLTMTRTQYDAVARQSLYVFIRRTVAELEPSTQFESNWHIRLLAAELEAMYRGENRRLIANIPPRNLKSICGSVAFVAWALGHDPTLKFMCVSYGLDLAEKLGRDCRQVMNSDWYKAMFPLTRISPVRSTALDFETTLGGGRMGSSRASGITGRGADYIFIDDPVKPDEMYSEGMRAQSMQFISSTLATRLNKKKTGRMAVFMQRLHVDDLSGKLLLMGGWKHLNLPAIAPRRMTFIWRDLFGTSRWFWEKGQALHPSREGVEDLAETRRLMGEYHFTAQYLQAPAPMSGNIFDLTRFTRYDPKDLPAKFDEIIQSYDTATAGGDLNDYSVCVTFGRLGNTFWILSVDRVKLDYKGLYDRMKDLYERDRPARILVEECPGSAHLLQILKHAGWAQIVGCRPKGDKRMRASQAAVVIQSGRVYSPNAAGWLQDFEYELIMFPDVGNDDQVDALSQGLIWLNANGQEPHITRFYREEVEAMWAAEKPSDKLFGVRPGRWMTAPPYAVAITSIPDGGFTAADADGVFWVPEDEFRTLLLNCWEAV